MDYQIAAWVLALSVLLLQTTANDEQNGPVTRIQSVAGMLTNLPCNITPSSPTDRVNIVLWYKDGLGKPLYSFDLRRQSLDSHGKIWASETNSEVARAQLHIHSEPTAVLALHGVTQEDAGTYNCRVDFKKSPTRYRKIALDVIVPPTKAIIMDERGMELNGNRVGPVMEGSTLILTCDIIGGWPASTVSWWQDGQLIDHSYEEIIPGKSRNTMKVESLQRHHRHTEFTCSGNNNNRSQALSRAVILDLYLRPLSVELGATVANVPLFSGHNQSFTCLAFGSFPAPSVSWWIDDRFQIDTHQEVTEDNRTLSTLFLHASREMHGGKLSCQVENPMVPNSRIEDSRTLQIHYPPEVSIQLGSKLNAVDIREGDDVYFECTIDAFPAAERISWKKDNETLTPNESEGILINEFSLVLQNVGHHSIGKYMCLAANDAGKGSSQQVFLDVKYSPRCGRAMQTMGVGRNEEARLVCHIDANPPPDTIKWRFNSSTHFATLPPEKFFTDRSMSVASYTPKSEIDYGTLSCWASNEVGDQKRPCIFHVIPAGPPDPVSGCQVKNKTFTSLSLECSAGYDGGLKQYFVAILCPYTTFTEVLDSQESSSNLVNLEKLNCEREIASQRNFNGPAFTFDHLPHGSPFSLAIFAQNIKGRSLAFVMRAFTLRSAERQVELQEVPPGLSDHRSAAGAASANEHLPAATQVRSFFLSKPGWIGLTIILPLLFCFISAGVWRTIRHTSRTNAQQSNEHHSRSFIKNPGSSSRSNQNQISSLESSLIRKGSSSVQVQQQQSQPPANSQQPPIDAMVDYPEVATLQNWRPVSTWNTTSRLQTNKGKYVFTSRHPPPSLPLHPQQQQPQSFSRGDKQPQQPRRASIDENGGQMMSVITTPHMHFATLPRRPMQKEPMEEFKMESFHPAEPLVASELPSPLVSKPPKEFADETSSTASEAATSASAAATVATIDHHHHHHHHPVGNVLVTNTSDLHLTRF